MTYKEEKLKAAPVQEKPCQHLHTISDGSPKNEYCYDCEKFIGIDTPPTTTPVLLTDGVTVPLAVLEAAEASLGSFCSDHGWSDMDMQNMDNLSACIAQHKAAHGITKGKP